MDETQEKEFKKAIQELKKIKKWDFENLAFKGGGAKVMAYVGACEVRGLSM